MELTDKQTAYLGFLKNYFSFEEKEIETLCQLFFHKHSDKLSKAESSQLLSILSNAKTMFDRASWDKKNA